MSKPEMHWSRWGDPAQAAPLSESAFALVDACIVGAEHVLTDHETRLHRTRGKSTPDMLKLRAGDGTDSPDAVVRPGSHEEVAALIDWAVAQHVAVVPF